MYVLSLFFALTIFGVNHASAQTHHHWSHRKKDAVIGGAAGAGVGLMVGHKKGKSALIGGAAGATVGYLAGRHKDRKGRY